MNCGTHLKQMNHCEGCCSPKLHRHFLSNDEKLKQLEHYKECLVNEIKGVEKAIEQLHTE